MILFSAFRFLLLAFLTCVTAFRSTEPSLNVRSSLMQRRAEAANDRLVLSDTVLVASIDGKFHALNRTTGRVKWSMHKPPANIHSVDPSIKEPPIYNLVRSLHRDPPADDNEDVGTEETYIIEPQSGEIFVLPPGAASSAPLEKLPFTVPKLVDLSPFRLQVHNEHRMFLGRKETSFITLDLDTGDVISIDDTDSCIWKERSIQDSARYRPDEGIDRKSYYELFDEDSSDAPSRKPSLRREIVIGRTDYYLTVRTDGQRVYQRLKFSVYGPNSADRDLQERWIQPLDGRYLQPLPDGRVFSFRPRDEEYHSFEWFVPFPKPAVAVFDVVMSAGQISPFILLQPRPSLHALFPGPQYAKELSLLKERTYVGIIGGSLFAMSHVNFPLVSVDYRFSAPRPIGGGPTDYGKDVGIPIMERECTAYGCLVGTHTSHGDSASSRFSRLIEAKPPKLLIDGPADVATAASLSLPGGQPSSLWSEYGVQSIMLAFCVLICVQSITLASGAVARYAQFWNRSGTLQVQPSLEAADITPGEAVAPTAAAEEQVEPKLAVAFANPPPKVASDEGDGDHSDGEGEGDEGEDSRRRRRRRRGKRKIKGNLNSMPIAGDELRNVAPGNVTPGNVVAAGPMDADLPQTQPSEKEDYIVVPTAAAEATDPHAASALAVESPNSSLTVSDVVLGYGSSGTVVYKGTFQGRSVAVKRLLQDFVTVASREVALLQESDDHPNVIRYFYQEQRDTFLYIALELCPASLEDIIARPNTFTEISAYFQPKRALAQIAAGLRHLHALKIIHRDIKPQNILVSQPKNGAQRMLISDFGLCKKLGHEETSFLPTQHGPLAAGTVGWRAPEILRREVDLDISSTESLGGAGTRGEPNGSSVGDSGTSTGTNREGRTRLTKSVDIFALGCLFFYTLTGGEHPYGGPFERESNILRDNKDLTWLEKFGEEGEELRDLIERMLASDPRTRPDTSAILIHPFFWTPARRLGFLQDASDRFEIMERDPPEKGLIALETGAFGIVGTDWQRRLDKIFLDNLGRFRKYNGKSVQDLMRALRNKKHHYQDLPDNVRKHLGPLPDGFLSYFTRRFPRLFLHVYYVVANYPELRHDSMFKPYFELQHDG